jgi:hypothetical protein
MKSAIRPLTSLIRYVKRCDMRKSENDCFHRGGGNKPSRPYRQRLGPSPSVPLERVCAQRLHCLRGRFRQAYGQALLEAFRRNSLWLSL